MLALLLGAVTLPGGDAAARAQEQAVHAHPVRKGPTNVLGIPMNITPGTELPQAPPRNDRPRMTRQEQLELWGRDTRKEPDTTGGTCKPSTAIAPCAALGDVAGLGNTSQPSVAEGNPVNPLTGQKYQVDLDVAPLPGQLGLEIKRHYSSALASVQNPLGRGWTLSYDTRLFTTRTTIQIIQADGRRLMFRRQDAKGGGITPMNLADKISAPAGATSAASATATANASRQAQEANCSSDRPEDGEVLILSQGGYRWTWPTGRQLEFDRNGYLVLIREPRHDGGAASEAAGQLNAGSDEQRIRVASSMPAQEVKDEGSGTAGHMVGPETDASGPEGNAVKASARWAVLRIQRDHAGRIVQVTDPAGRSMRFGYDHQGHLSTIDHPQGRWQYRVSSSGQLLSATSPEQARRIYRYDDPGFRSALTAIDISAPALKKVVRMGEWRYDHQGRVIAYSGPKGKLKFSYFPEDAQGIRRTVVADLDGREKTYRFREHRGEWQTISVTGQDCAHCSTADRHFRYDAQNRLVGTREQIDLENSSLSRMLRFERDRFGRIERVWRLHWKNDAEKRDAAPQAGKDALSLVRRYEYADDGSVLPSLVARPSVLPGKEYTVRYVYRNIAGKERAVRITESGYSHGELVERSVSVDYDEKGRLVRLDGPLPGTDDRIDFRREETRTPRIIMTDGLGRRISADRDDGWLASSLAWLQDNARFQLHPGEIRHQAANGVRQSVIVDDFNRITQTESPDGGVETTWHDVADRVIRQTDSTGAEVRLVHDDFGRLLKRTVRASDGSEEITHYRHEGVHLVEVRNPVVTERYAHDAQGRLIQREAIVHPVSGKQQSFVTRYRYDGQDVLPSQVTLPNGAVITQAVRNGVHAVGILKAGAEQAEKLYDRELHGRTGMDGVRDEVWRFGNGTERLLRWARGDRLLSVQDSRPAAASATEAAGASLRKESVPGAITAEALRYNDTGKITAISSPVREQRFVWSKAGYLMIAQEWQASNQHDPASGDATVPSSANTNTEAGVDADAGASVFMSAPKVSGVLPVAGLRTTAFRPTSAGRPDPASLRVMPRSLSETVKVAKPVPDGFIRQADWWYAWDDNGNRIFTGRHVANAARDADVANAGKDATPSHDATNSSSSVFRSGVIGQASQYLPGTNRLRNVPHDAAGRPLQWQGWSISWHPGGQISTMTHADGRVLRYFHNHRGERVAREENGQWSFFDYDNGKLQAEVSAVHPAMRVWWHEGEIPALMIDASNRDAWTVWADSGNEDADTSFLEKLSARWFGRVFGRQAETAHRISWLHVGHHGMPLAVSDADGDVIWQQQYGPFGEKMPRSSGNTRETGNRVEAATGFKVGITHHDPRLRFPGQWEDPATGLYYNLMRDYDPALGRYLSPDPLGLRAGPNPYLYVNGDPVRNVDPTGLLLFAFDGTHNDVKANTNIWKFYQLYQAEGNGAKASDRHRAYLEGVGIMGGEHTAYRREDEAEAGSFEGLVSDYWKENVEYHMQQFREAVNALKPGETLHVDVVGFSRGASQATEFGRLVARELRSGKLANAAQVNLRFMGLLDPVPTNMYELNRPSDFLQGQRRFYRWETECDPMGVDDEWESVVNILAGHDNREGLFRATSLGSQINTSRPGALREEFVLAGAHSDIGGGYEPEDGGDLSDVALWALIERAREAGVAIDDPGSTSHASDEGPSPGASSTRGLWAHVQNPVAHFEFWTDYKPISADGRDILIDGVWVRDRLSGINGSRLSLNDIAENPAQSTVVSVRPFYAPDNAEAFGAANMIRPDLRQAPVQAPVQSVDVMVGWRSISDEMGTFLVPLENVKVDMQKYCAYLLKKRFLKKCPY